jgi:hypothetical protein
VSAIVLPEWAPPRRKTPHRHRPTNRSPPSCLNQPELSAGELAMDSGAADGRARPANWSVAGWSIGLVLYLLLVSVILLQWLTVPMTPVALGSPYWILMGATA